VTRPFVDLVELTVKAGDGGDGCASFNSEPYNPRAGPDGGNGGGGGNVVVVAQSNVSTLSEFNYKSEITAENGGHGGSKNKTGARGDDRVIQVPEGCVIEDAETGETLGEVTEEGDRITVADGGEGGRGNVCFANSQRQAPNFREFGAEGQRRRIRIELKLLADVGIVGMPNAGKSTLLSNLTSAHPEIAEYPFTTVAPNLGVMFRDYQQITLCDIPGLIKDAHKDAGLGFDFLRHADRTKIFVHVVDLSSDNPVQKFHTIQREIESYDPEMLDKPMVIVLNKIDLVDDVMVRLFHDEINVSSYRIIPISALEETNLDELKSALWEEYDTLSDSESTTESDTVERVIRMEQKQPVSVHKINGQFVLHGDRVNELVNRFDLSNPDAMAYVREQLLNMNLHKKLDRAGCEPGDSVQVGRQVFEYTG